MGKDSKAVRSRLGRGLSSLISVSQAASGEIEQESDETPAGTAPVHAGSRLAGLEGEPPTARVLEISTDSIDPNPSQPRRSFDGSSLADLAASMKATGLIQPIVVKKVGSRFQLIAGERRLRAAQQAGMPALPAIVREVDGPTQAQMALIENIQRQDLNAIDRAVAYRTLIDQLGLTQAELATRLGENRTQITHFLRLLDLGKRVQDMVQEGRLSLGHAKLLAGVPDHAEQERLAALILSQDLSVRNLERLLQTGEASAASSRETPEPPKPSAHIQSLEKSLSSQLGLRVQVREASKKGAGRVIIHYGSLDQFDDLTARLGVEVD